MYQQLGFMGDFMGVTVAFNIADTDKEARAQLKNGGRVCQCAECGQYFNGIAPFDRHLQNMGTDHVTCSTVAQMRQLGMVHNIHGVWSVGTMQTRKADVA